MTQNCVVGVFLGTIEIWTERSNQTERHRGENERKHVATTREFYPFPSLLGPSLFWEGCCLPRSKSVQDRPLRFRLCLFVCLFTDAKNWWLAGWFLMILSFLSASPLAMYFHNRNRNHLIIFIYTYLFIYAEKNKYTLGLPNTMPPPRKVTPWYKQLLNRHYIPIYNCMVYGLHIKTIITDGPPIWWVGAIVVRF